MATHFGEYREIVRPRRIIFTFGSSKYAPFSVVTVDIKPDGAGSVLTLAHRVEFTIVPTRDGSDITWAMSGKQPFMGKLFSVFVNTEKMVSSAFETGLADLKARAET